VEGGGGGESERGRGREGERMMTGWQGGHAGV